MNSESFSDRLRQVIGSQSVLSFAQKCEIGESSVRKYLEGRIPGLDAAERIASTAGVNLQWLATGKGPRTATDVASTDDHYVGIPRLNARLAAGSGAWNADVAEILDYIPFTSEFLGKRLGHTSSNGLIILEARGDSMDPTIADGDLVMIDQHQNELADGIFAFVLNGAALIKRIHPTISGEIEVISDNTRYRPEVLSANNAAQFQVIGRAVWCGHHFTR